jgi:hypothetical protein
MKKKPITEKQIRKSNITQMSVVATMVDNLISEPGVCGFQQFLDRRKSTPTELHFEPGVLLQPWKFMELFGEDTDFEYIKDRDGDLTIITQVNGVTFYALACNSDLIRNGRLV